MNNRSKEIHEQSVIVDGHNHMMKEIYQRRYAGEKAVFSNYYAPQVRAAGINVILTNVGGDNFGLTDNTDLLLVGTLSILDMLWEEAEESKDTMDICRCGQGSGKRQLLRRQTSWAAGLPQARPYIFAVGPPTSLSVPRNSGWLLRRSTSAVMESGERD